MLKKEYTLSDVVEYFKKNEIPSFEEEIDEFGNYFITAARLAAVILAPNPLTALSNFCAGIDAASLRVSKLFSWLPDKLKYGNKGREKLAIQRYEISSIIYVKLLSIAITNAFKDELAPTLQHILKDIKFEEEDKIEIENLSKEAENSQLRISIDTFATINEEKISELIDKTINPLLPFLIKVSEKCDKDEKKTKKNKEINVSEIKKQFVTKSYMLFNAFLINFSSEFPEFCLWCDLKNKDEIIKEITKIKKHLSSIKNYDNAISESLLKFQDNIKLIVTIQPILD